MTHRVQYLERSKLVPGPQPWGVSQATGGVQNVHQSSSSADVAQEGMAQPLIAGCTRNEARNVCHGQ